MSDKSNNVIKKNSSTKSNMGHIKNLNYQKFAGTYNDTKPEGCFTGRMC